MAARPDLSFKAQREALAQAASIAAANPTVDSTYGTALQAAQGLTQQAAQIGQGNLPGGGSGVTAQALSQLLNNGNGDLNSKLDGLLEQIKTLNGEQGATTQTGGPAVGAIDYSNYKPGNEMAKLILETAQDIGADPLDLATAISYETAGTFDPTKRGPTTQWGQHRGLIQFGEPQAQEYGVDWNDPLYSQLGKGKAVSNYFRKNGWKPGMAGVDLYSIINAGAPGRYSASDAANGGAPGDVWDKWHNQMGGHRSKAAKLLGL